MTLLLGPTAIWLVFLVIRGREARHGESFLASSESSGSAQAAADRIDRLIAEGFWVCPTCRSMNRHEAKACYGCRTVPTTKEGAARDETPFHGVPVMAEGITQPPDRIPEAAVVRARPPEPLVRGVPEVAEQLARPPATAPKGPAARRRSPSTAAATSAAAAAATGAASATVAASPAVAVSPAVAAVDGPGRQPAPTRSPDAVPASASVCPFLGLSHDRTTWCGFPDSRNVCHAVPAPGETSFRSAARSIIDRSARARSRPIEAAHQGSTCLTAAHEQCARYPAGDPVPARR